MNLDLFSFDLRQFNHTKLKEFCDEKKFNYEELCHYKSEGFAMIWVDKNTNKIVGFNTKKESQIVVTSLFREMLMKVPSYTPPKKTVSPEALDLDSILEKISKYGINSLKQEEKNFLENLNK